VPPPSPFAFQIGTHNTQRDDVTAHCRDVTPHCDDVTSHDSELARLVQLGTQSIILVVGFLQITYETNQPHSPLNISINIIIVIVEISFSVGGRPKQQQFEWAEGPTGVQEVAGSTLTHALQS